MIWKKLGEILIGEAAKAAYRQTVNRPHIDRKDIITTIDAVSYKEHFMIDGSRIIEYPSGKTEKIL